MEKEHLEKLFTLVDLSTLVETMEALIDWYNNPEQTTHSLMAEAIMDDFIKPLGKLEEYQSEEMIMYKSLKVDGSFLLVRDFQLFELILISNFQLAALDLYCAVHNNQHFQFAIIENVEKHWIDFQRHWRGRLKEIELFKLRNSYAEGGKITGEKKTVKAEPIKEKILTLAREILQINGVVTNKSSFARSIQKRLKKEGIEMTTRRIKDIVKPLLPTP